MLSILILGAVGTWVYCHHQDTVQGWVEGYRYLYEMYHQSHLDTIRHLLSSGASLTKLYLTQYLFHNSNVVRKGVYDIEYTIHLKTFRFRTTYRKGPCRYRSFHTQVSEEEIDVSSNVFPYVGPNHDFHRIPYTPTELGYSNLIIHYDDGTSRVFGPDEVLE